MKRHYCLDDEVLNLVKQINLSDAYFEFKLGEGLVYEYSPPRGMFSMPYEEIGKDAWKIFQNEIHHMLCEDSGSPKSWVNELISGDIRVLILAIVSSITSKFDISLGIAIPIVALIIKKNILTFCSDKPSIANKTIEQLLQEMKDRFNT